MSTPKKPKYLCEHCESKQAKFWCKECMYMICKDCDKSVSLVLFLFPSLHNGKETM